MKLKTLEEKVTHILTEYPDTREDDFKLVYRVWHLIAPRIRDMQLRIVFGNHAKLKLPTFESITRCRRKVQEKNQDLVDWKTADKRTERIEEFKDYSRT